MVQCKEDLDQNREGLDHNKAGVDQGWVWFFQSCCLWMNWVQGVCKGEGHLGGCNCVCTLRDDYNSPSRDGDHGLLSTPSPGNCSHPQPDTKKHHTYASAKEEDATNHDTSNDTLSA